MKYKAIFLKKIGNSEYRKIVEQTFKETDKTVRFKEHTFPIPKNRDTYNTEKTSYTFYDFDNSKILNFVKTNIGINPKMLDKLIAQDLVGKLVRAVKASMEETDKWKFMPFAIAFIIGCVVGYLFGTNPALIGG